MFLGYVLYAEGIWKGYILVADIEELGKDGRIWNPCLETECKGSVNANGEQFYNPYHRSNSQVIWTRSSSENIDLG